MRLTRIVAVTALVASAVVLPSAADATPVASPYTAFTMSRSLDGTNTGPAVLDTTTSNVAADVATTPGSIAFTATPTSGVTKGVTFTATITAPTAGAYPIGTLVTTAAAATDTAPGFSVHSSATGCSASTGTLTIAQADSGGAGQELTDFAAEYTFVCNTGGPTVSGTLRFNSTEPYTAVAVSPAGWDFGWQTTGSDGTPKTFTVTNRGSGDLSISAASIAGGAFRVTNTTCTAAVVSGGTCQVKVVPHPLTSIGGANQGTLGALHLTLASGDPVDVPVREEGRPVPTTYVRPGPGRITLAWGLQPNPIGSSLDNFAIFRGVPGQRAVYYHAASQLTTSFVDTAVKTGQPYFYQLFPKFKDGSTGDLTPPVAATAWPVYSAGMYHRLPSSERILAAHTIVSGHPYTLQVTGKPGIPTTGVSAVALQVTAVKPTSTTAVTVYPSGTSRPAVPDLTVQRGSARTNYVLARIGAGGRIVLSTSSGYTPVSVDVFGFYSAAGLSTAYGQGGAMHTYLQQGTIMDTKAFGIGAVPSGYFVDAPVDFAPVDTPHVTSLLVEVTAYGSSGGGTITAYATNHRAPGTSVLTYAGGRVTTNVALVAADRFVDTSTGDQFPSVALLNRGSRSVQLIVTILGFVDDNSFAYGERYAAGSAVHLLSTTMYTGSTRVINPGTHAGPYTTALNTKVVVGNPAATTSLALWPGNVSNIGAPARPQVRANAHETTVGSTPAPVGNGNLLDIRNTSGQARIDVWSFGRWDFYPQPTSPHFVSVRPARPDQLAPGAAPAAAAVRPIGVG